MSKYNCYCMRKVIREQPFESEPLCGKDVFDAITTNRREWVDCEDCLSILKKLEAQDDKNN